jgi:hypothetical protein
MEIRNSKSEARNKFKTKKAEIQNAVTVIVLNITVLNFGFVSGFAFRAWNSWDEGVVYKFGVWERGGAGGHL